MSAATPSDPRPAGVPRRLEAGDWVVAAPWVRSLPGLGKLVEGDYDARDGALLRARVEWTHGSHWMPVADLERIEPEEELILARAALERRVVGPDRAARLRELLGAVERGRRSYVRSPGLLDLLWAGLEEEDRPRGLVQLFDDASGLLRAARRPLFAPLEPSLVQQRPTAVDPPDPEGVLGLVLGAFDERALLHLVERLGAEPAAIHDPRLLRSQLRALVALEPLLDALSERQLRRAARVAGIVRVDRWSVAELREALLRLAAPAPDRPPRPPFTLLELVEALPARDLGTVLLRTGTSPGALGRDHASLACEVVRRGLGTSEVVEPLGYAALRAVATQLRLTVRAEEPDALRAAVVAAVAAPAPAAGVAPAPTPRDRDEPPPARPALPPDQVLPAILEALDAAALTRLVRGLGELPARADAPSLREQVRELEVPLPGLLASIGAADLVAVGAALGLGLDRPPDQLRRRLAALSEAPSGRETGPADPAPDAVAAQGHREQLAAGRDDLVARALVGVEARFVVFAAALAPLDPEWRRGLVRRAGLAEADADVDVDVEGLSARLAAARAPLDDLLRTLTPAELGAAAERLGVPAAGRSPSALRWALGLLAGLDGAVLIAAARAEGLEAASGAAAARAIAADRLPLRATLARLEPPALGRAAFLLGSTAADAPAAEARAALIVGP